MKINLDAPPEEVQIQIVPLIDVIFCILTFFILAALQLTRQQGIELDLPKASTGSPQMREMLVVTLTPEGRILTDQNPQPVDYTQLAQILRTYQQNRPDGLLVLNASRRALYDEVIQVLDLMRSIGGDRVALSTAPAEANQPLSSPSPTVSPTLIPLPGTTPNLAPGGQYQIPQPGSPTPAVPGGITPVPTVPVPASPNPYAPPVGE